MELENLLADKSRLMDVNVIREILKVVSQPGMVSLAGGIPAPESFPIEIIRELTAIVIDKYASAAFPRFSHRVSESVFVSPRH